MRARAVLYTYLLVKTALSLGRQSCHFCFHSPVFLSQAATFGVSFVTPLYSPDGRTTVLTQPPFLARHLGLSFPGRGVLTAPPFRARSTLSPLSTSILCALIVSPPTPLKRISNPTSSIHKTARSDYLLLSFSPPPKASGGLFGNL